MPPAPSRTYRVGEFARLAGVTPRALHHYDRLGLLKPRRTAVGYRAYTDRIILIEDTSEILIHKDDLVRMESRRSQPKLGTDDPMKAVTIADLVVASLRYRPDRIILGEVRGGEA